MPLTGETVPAHALRTPPSLLYHTISERTAEAEKKPPDSPVCGLFPLAHGAMFDAQEDAGETGAQIRGRHVLHRDVHALGCAAAPRASAQGLDRRAAGQARLRLHRIIRPTCCPGACRASGSELFIGRLVQLTMLQGFCSGYSGTGVDLSMRGELLVYGPRSSTSGV